MRIRRFRARDMKGVLSLVREALGPRALILEARQSSSRHDGSRHVAAVAACDPDPDLPPKPPRNRDRQGAPRPAAPMATSPTATARDSESVADKVSFLSGLVASRHFSRLTPWARELYLELLQCEVDADLAFGILEALAHEDGVSPRDAVRQQIRPLLRNGGCLRPGRGGQQIVVLVGGPGVGKTTTCAKLAARLRDGGHSVGLLSLDPPAFGVHTSLESIGALLGLPAVHADSAGAVRDLLGGAFASLATVLVDTSGAVWSDGRWGSRLKGLLSGIPGVDVHVLVPAAMRARDQLRSVTAALPLEPQALTFTKLDETDRYGSLLSLPLKTALPVAYLSGGPRIPEDIQEARIDGLLDLITQGFDGAAAGDGRRSERNAA